MSVAVIAGELVQRTWLAPVRPPAGQKLQVGLLATSLAVALFSLGIVLPIYRAEAARYRGRQSIDRLAMNPSPALNDYRDTLTSASVAFSEAVGLDSGNAQAWADRAYATELWAHLAPARMNELGKEAEVAANKALERSVELPEFWVRRGIALDMQGREAEASEAFVKALELARFNSIIWYYYAYHQSLNSKNKAEVLISIENCLRLDPDNRSALALRQRMSSSQ